MRFNPSKSIMGCTIIALGSLSVGLETGVVMAGRADNRGDTQLHGLHRVAPGIWGGFISIVSGVLGMMADNRTQMPFRIPKYYYPYFWGLAVSSFLGFLISVISLGVNGAMIANVASYCSSTRIDAQLYLYVDLFCYGIVAAVILIPVSSVLFILHGIFSYYCILTIRHVFWNRQFEGRQRLHTNSTTGTASMSSIGDDVNIGSRPKRNLSEVSESYEEGVNPNYIGDSGEAMPNISAGTTASGRQRAPSSLQPSSSRAH
ncbi:uncharacterized protein LOC129602369 [Paramacrobiotus metropolitanus]|uniref:uncharacterized protein LOC129602369 n=1 Tax=Paramacrobiotus metropolitanus TaxID=2943436 RepID=UPI0024459B15|nr:uncharacterized protein LOC129602369 [Paramacrobiotus metropolitanus]